MTTKDWAGTVLLTSMAALIVIGMVWGEYAATESRAASDPETLCPATGVTRATALLLDRTDAFGPLYYAATRQEIERIKRLLIAGERFSIHAILDTPSYANKPLLTVCRPLSAEDVSPINDNPLLRKKTYEELFENPLAKHIAELETPSEAPYSPLIEMLQGAQFVFDSSLEHRRLSIISDLLQNTPELSFYRGVPGYDTFKASPYGRSLQIDLSGIEITVIPVRNSKAAGLQTPKLVEFWRRLLEDAGAATVTLGAAHDG